MVWKSQRNITIKRNRYSGTEKTPIDEIKNLLSKA